MNGMFEMYSEFSEKFFIWINAKCNCTPTCSKSGEFVEIRISR